VAVSIGSDAEFRKTELIAAASMVTTVENPSQQEFAVAAARDIKALLRGVEESRTAVKAPVLTLGRDIDRVASEFADALEKEAKRLLALVSKYQAEQQRIAAEVERARLTELQRIEDERLKSEAEAKRLADEQAKSAKSIEDLDRIAREEEERKAKSEAVAAQQSAPLFQAPTVEPVRAAGMSVRKVWRFRVLDVRDLAFKRPDLVRIEANSSAITAALKRGETLPAVEAWEETEAGVRV
jgi:hypothetical protein